MFLKPHSQSLRISRWFPVAALIMLGGLFIALHAYTIRGYDFIWAADSFFFKKNTDVVLATGNYPVERPLVYPPRPNNYPQFFSLFTSYLSYTTGLSSTSLYYEWLIYLMVITVLPIFLMVRMLTKSAVSGILASALAVTPFIVYREMEQPRAQISTFFLGPVILWLLMRAVSHRKRRDLMIAGLLTVIGFRFHDTFILLLVPLITAIGLIYQDWFRRYWKRVILFGLLGTVAVVVMDQIISLRVFSRIEYLWSILFVPQEDADAFQSTYTWSYYLRYLGPPLLLFGFVGGMILVRTAIVQRRLRGEHAILMVSTLLYLMFIEILPRLGIHNEVFAFRSLPHLALLLAVIAGVGMYQLRQFIGIRVFQWVAVGVILASLFIFPSSKLQTWIVATEPAAAAFMREQTPPNSIFFSQPLNGPLISGLAERTSYRTDIGDRRIFFEYIHSIFYAPTSAAAYQQIQLAVSPNNPLYRNIVTRIEPDDADRPLYVLYSWAKAKGLAHRRTENDVFIQANVNNFHDTQYFEQVYTNDDVTIWRVKPLAGLNS